MKEREPIETYLKPAFDETRTASAWNRIAARRRAPEKPVRRRVLAGMLALTAASALAIELWPRSPAAQGLASSDPAVSLAPGAVWTALGHDVVLDDESRVALAVGARLQILANEGTRFSTLLETGSAHFDVHPDGPRRWEIETALATVEVVGTAFTVSVRDRELEVSVDRGVVLVHGERVPGRVARLVAGQHIVVGPAPAPPPPPPPQVVVAAPAPPPRPPAPRPAVVRAPDVAAPRPPALADVVAAADRLSAAGDAAGAAKLLEGVRARDGERTSGLVVFTLGRLYLDALAQPEQAAAAFDQVITSGNPRSLVEDAYARRVEALVRAGLRDRATAAFAAYEHAYPHGRRLEAMRARVAAP